MKRTLCGVWLLAVLAGPVAAQDTMAVTPVVTLAEALERSARLDPDYVGALGTVESAEWGRRAARLAFILPSVSVGLDVTKYSSGFFNLGTGELQSTSVTARADARYELFSLRKLAELSRSGAALDAANADETRARFAAALLTEQEYYAVLAAHELLISAEQQVRRAEEGLKVARARVASGAVVQSDSLQLVLDLTRARVELLRQRAALEVAQLNLGRRVGSDRSVDAAPIDTAPPPELPIDDAAALALALEQGPDYRLARADERAADAVLRAQRSDYFPTVNLSGAHQRFDSKFFPSARAVSSVTLGFSWPLWNSGQREVAVAEARTRSNVARAIRADLERGARADVTEALAAYRTARASVVLSQTALAVAQENYRVQESRYRAGAATILDLRDAQVDLAQAEAELVQARYGTRLALAGLEAMLGRRLYSDDSE
jgi:outer membrane protein TolC